VSVGGGYWCARVHNARASQHCRLSHWIECHSTSCAGRAAPCQDWVEGIYTHLQSQAGCAPVPLSRLGIVVKKPAGVGKQQKLLPLLMADARFHWYEAPDESQKRQVVVLAVAVKTEEGFLPEVLETVFALMLFCGRELMTLVRRHRAASFLWT
jgi:hypothetical protein